jgi:hypothetical protein
MTEPQGFIFQRGDKTVEIQIGGIELPLDEDELAPFDLVADHYQWFHERLDDPSLLDRAVLVQVGVLTEDLAVPVGGRRRMGELMFDTVEYAAAARDVLAAQPDLFPDLRLIEVVDRDNVELRWGIDVPYNDPRAAGLAFGYSDAAVSEYMAGWPLGLLKNRTP